MFRGTFILNKTVVTHPPQDISYRIHLKFYYEVYFGDTGGLMPEISPIQKNHGNREE
jgi:hypothetical protein